MADLADDPDFNLAFHVLVDLRKMKYGPSRGDAQAIASRLADLKVNFRGRVGIVVSGDFLFGMARMTRILAEIAGSNMNAFRNYDSAFQWIQQGGF